MSSSSPRRRVTFAESDVVVFLPPRTPSEEVSDTERPQIMPPNDPLSNSPSSSSTLSTLSTSDPYTPPSNSKCDISIEGQDVDITNSNSLRPTLSDAIAHPGAETLDMYEPHDATLHPCLSTSNPVQWNMLNNPDSPLRPQELDQFGHDFMMRDAFVDSISKIRFNCEILPWPIIIDIEEEGFDRGSPRIDDIFNSIYASLWKLASSVDFDHQTTERQFRIQKAYLRRCRQLSIAEESDGLRRIDFLEGQTMFFGLSPGNSDDEWHLHVRQE